MVVPLQRKDAITRYNAAHRKPIADQQHGPTLYVQDAQGNRTPLSQIAIRLDDLVLPEPTEEQQRAWIEHIEKHSDPISGTFSGTFDTARLPKDREN